MSGDDHTKHDENSFSTIENELKSNGKKGPEFSSDMALLVNMMLSCNINSDIVAKRMDQYVQSRPENIDFQDTPLLIVRALARFIQPKR